MLATGGADGRVNLWRTGWGADGSRARGVGGDEGVDNASARRQPRRRDGGGGAGDCSRGRGGDGGGGDGGGGSRAPAATIHIGGGGVRCVAMARSSRAQLSVTGGEDGHIRVWSRGAAASGGDSACVCTCELVMAGHGGAITSLALCPPLPPSHAHNHAHDQDQVDDSGDDNSATHAALLMAGCDDGVYGVWRVAETSSSFTGTENRGGNGHSVGCGGSGGSNTTAGSGGDASDGVRAGSVVTTMLEGGGQAHVSAIRASLLVGTDAGVVASTSEAGRPHPHLRSPTL